MGVFADELEDLVRAVQLLLTHAGRFAAFYTECQMDGDPIDILEAERTRFGSALTNNGWPFDWIDFTENERQIWTSQLDVAHSLIAAFEAEGNASIVHSRIGEAEFCLERIRTGRMKRYLYVARPRT